MVVFKVGDKVVLKPAYKRELKERWRDTVGTVVCVHLNSNSQFCRVSYSESMFDYEDFGAWRLVLVESNTV